MKLLAIALGLLLLGTDVFWLYNFLDCGVSLTYQRDSFDSSMKSIDQVLALANAIGLSAEDDSVQVSGR